MPENTESPIAGENLESKREAYLKLCEGEPEAIFVLSGGIVKKKGKVHQATDERQSGSYADTVDHGLISGGKARSLAAVEMAQVFPNAKIVTLSRPEGQSSHAAVIAKEITNKGVSRERIIEREESYSTLTELFEIIKLIHQEKLNQTAVITNEYQIPRARLMLKKLAQLKDRKGLSNQPAFQEALTYYEAHKQEIKIVLVAAEQVLPYRDQRYGALIDKARKTDLWKQKLLAETKGINDLETGGYKT